VKAVWATFVRELRAYFFSPLAYIVMFFFLVINGITFIGLMNYLNDPRAAGGPPMGYFFSSTGLVLLIAAVLLTMRLLSEELRSGSIEVLMTAPVTEGQVVAGKYLAALAFFIVLWLPTLAYPLLIHAYETVDWGPVAAGYLGVFGVGALFLSIGVFASATTKSQLVAAMMTAAVLIFLFLLSWLGGVSNSEAVRKVVEYVDFGSQLDEFSRGIVDTRRLALYLTGTLFFLFLATRALEDKKWR
jgi:ABC-2 type transport system permease protein